MATDVRSRSVVNERPGSTSAGPQCLGSATSPMASSGTSQVNGLATEAPGCPLTGEEQDGYGRQVSAMWAAKARPVISGIAISLTTSSTVWRAVPAPPPRGAPLQHESPHPPGHGPLLGMPLLVIHHQHDPLGERLSRGAHREHSRAKG
jgi:hypothetical protein